MGWNSWPWIWYWRYGDDYRRKIDYWNMFVCGRYYIRNVNMHSNLAELLDACKPLTAKR